MCASDETGKAERLKVAVDPEAADEVFAFACMLGGSATHGLVLLSLSIASALVRSGAPPETVEQAALAVGPFVARMAKTLGSPSAAGSPSPPVRH